MSDTKVYVVTSGDYSDYHIEEIFKNKESAEMYCAIHNKSRENDFCEIEEYPICNIIGKVEICLAVHVRFDDKGKIDYVHTYLSERGQEKFIKVSEKNNIYRLLFYTQRDLAEEQIEKIAHDKYAEYMARESGI